MGWVGRLMGQSCEIKVGGVPDGTFLETWLGVGGAPKRTVLENYMEGKVGGAPYGTVLETWPEIRSA